MSPSAWFFPLVFGLFSSHPSLQETYTFKVQVRNVYLDVFVTRDGKPVTDLERGNFVVLDNGVQQEFALVDVESVPMSAMLVLDLSGSVHGQKLAHLRAAAHAFVSGLDEQDEAGLLTFTHRMQLTSRLGRNFEQLHRALDRTRGTGLTALNDTLFVALKFLEKARGRPLLLLFTDGLDNGSWLDDSDLREMARDSEAVIYSVGVQSPAGVFFDNRLMSGPETKGSQLLKRITQSTGGQVWYAKSTSDLKDVYLRILTEMETRYLLTYQPQGVSEEGWHEIEVKLKDRRGDVRARSGYYVTPAQN